MPSYEGNNRSIRGALVILDCGENGSTCDNSHEWQINRSYIISERVVGYCLGLSGRPANYIIETRAGSPEPRLIKKASLLIAPEDV